MTLIGENKGTKKIVLRFAEFFSEYARRFAQGHSLVISGAWNGEKWYISSVYTEQQRICVEN